MIAVVKRWFTQDQLYKLKDRISTIGYKDLLPHKIKSHCSTLTIKGYQPYLLQNVYFLYKLLAFLPVFSLAISHVQSILTSRTYESQVKTLKVLHGFDVFPSSPAFNIIDHTSCLSLNNTHGIPCIRIDPSRLYFQFFLLRYYITILDVTFPSTSIDWVSKH